jgi:hypothetical protein
MIGGIYTIPAALLADGTYTLTINKGVNYTFSGSETVDWTKADTNNKLTMDFTALRVAPIKGTIKGLPAGTKVAFTFTDSAKKSITRTATTTNAKGQYSLDAPVPVGVYTLELLATDYTFSPASRTVKITMTTTSLTLNFTAK